MDSYLANYSRYYKQAVCDISTLVLDLYKHTKNRKYSLPTEAAVERQISGPSMQKIFATERPRLLKLGIKGHLSERNRVPERFLRNFRCGGKFKTGAVHI